MEKYNDAVAQACSNVECKAACIARSSQRRLFRDTVAQAAREIAKRANSCSGRSGKHMGASGQLLLSGQCTARYSDMSCNHTNAFAAVGRLWLARH